MQRPTGLGDLKPDEWQRLEQLLDRFEHAWRGSTAVEIAPFLPPPDDQLCLVALCELVKADLEIRWRKGLPTLLDSYLTDHPELLQHPAVLPQLLFEEYRSRHRYGDKPDLATYQQRFPQCFTELQRLVQTRLPPPTPPAPTAPATPAVPGSGKLTAVGMEGGSVLPVGGGYRLLKRLGRGSFGEVWRAEAPGGVEMAIKIILRPLDHAEAQRELDALEIIKRLRHPFLLQTQWYQALEDRLLIAMELADASLRDRYKECRQAGLPGIPIAELLTYIQEAAEALDYLHGENVLHRDIKPENILLVGRHAKLADLGLARILEGNRSFTATCAGTPAYMAPETWRGRASRHSDQYSLAAAYAELRLGRRLFPGEALMQLMLDHTERTPALDPLPVAEQEVLFRALAKEAEQRFPSCSDFCEALREALASELSPVRSRPVSVGSGKPTPAPPTRELPARPAASKPPVPVGEQPTALDRPVDTPPSLERPAEAAKPMQPQWRDRAVPRRPSTRRRFLLAGVGLLAAVAGGGLYALKHLPFKAGSIQTTNGSPVPSEVDFLPSEWEKGEEARVVTAAGRKVYDRIARILDDGQRIPFLLIPQTGEDLSKPFYIMKHKVSNMQFAAFAQARPEALQGSQWQKGYHLDDGTIGPQDDNLPVLNVTWDEARGFAQWLGGNLPTALQWDTAAGRFHPSRPSGPFRGVVDDQKAGDIAVGGLAGPLPVGQAPRDESVYECRDMAGNGREWTRSLAAREDGTVPVDHFDGSTDVLLRGVSFRAHEPFEFTSLADSQKRGEALYDIGFRVMLEVP